MEAQLRVPYRDTAAADLVWRLGDRRHPALAILEFDWEMGGLGGHLELRLLGSSHQVVFTAGGAVISEVVACGQTQLGLPAAASRTLPGWDYRFRSRAHRLSPDRFGRWVERLAARLAVHPAALVGRFPGSPHAVTAVLAGAFDGDRLRWRSWHAYPQDRCVVTTSTAVFRR